MAEKQEAQQQEAQQPEAKQPEDNQTERPDFRNIEDPQKQDNEIGTITPVKH